MPIFREQNGIVRKLKSINIEREKKLQTIVENNLFEMLDMHFIATEYPTTSGGRIDTLAVDSSGAPVIIEYKRNRNDNVINQALSYLKWLRLQKVEFFEMLIAKKLDKDIVRNMQIDWKNPRVICIAESYSKFDVDTVEFISMRIELFRYRYYEENLFSLEALTVSEQKAKSSSPNILDKPTIVGHLKKVSKENQELFQLLRSAIFEMDENIKEKATSIYVAYCMIKNFAEIHIHKNHLRIYMRPIEYTDPRGLVEKVPDTYQWTLNRGVDIKSQDDLDYVMNLIEQSYKDVL